MINAAKIQRIRRRWRLLDRLGRKELGSQRYNDQRDRCDDASEGDVIVLLAALDQQKMRTHYWKLVSRMRSVAIEITERFTPPTKEEMGRFKSSKRDVDRYRRKMKDAGVKP